jgi:hypothetical protein
MAESLPVTGRGCRGCTLCCKLLGVEELEKPPSVWCGSCSPRTGCKIYELRPTECRSFYCAYLLDGNLSERWKPSQARLVVAFQEHRSSVEIYVDHADPHAWRQEPFYSQIQKWAHSAGLEQGQVVVWEGDRKIVVSAETKT